MKEEEAAHVARDVWSGIYLKSGWRVEEQEIYHLEQNRDGVKGL